MKKTLLVAALFVAALSALSEPIDSMLASDGLEIEGGEAVVNPYITDGLVCWYDGEWNTALGVHNPYSVEWRDLIRPQVSILLTSGHWESNCLTFLNENYIGQNNTGVAFNADEPCTFEAVCSIDSISETTTNPCSAVTFGPIIIRPFYLGQGVTKRVDMYWAHVLQWTSVAELPCGGTQTFVKEASVDDKCNYFVYSNASLKGSRFYNKTSIGAGITLNGYERANPFRRDVTLRVYCIRIYNRALSPEEVAFNHVVDSLRFNLP